MEFTNFNEIKAIDQARITKIIRWYKKTDYQLAILSGSGCSLDTLSLVKLLYIFANSTNIEKDFKHLVYEVFEIKREKEKI
ncbi:unnamed protein product [marine sediment metagenome]|uniref:Uncharacterized protein n=1 Tax=marine sediment metagenome TaxID=412755 RepID=X1J2Y2_9ZZZZ